MSRKRKFRLNKDINDYEDFDFSTIGGNLPQEPIRRHMRGKIPSIQDTEMEMMTSVNVTESGKSFPSNISELISFRIGEDKVQ